MHLAGRQKSIAGPDMMSLRLERLQGRQTFASRTHLATFAGAGLRKMSVVFGEGVLETLQTGSGPPCSDSEYLPGPDIYIFRSSI